MSGCVVNLKILFTKKAILTLWVVAIFSIGGVSSLRYNRGPLEEVGDVYKLNGDQEDDEEFTGNTYLDPNKSNHENEDQESLMERENESFDDEEEEFDDDDEEEVNVDLDKDDYLDRFSDTSLLEMEQFIPESDESESVSEERINPRVMNGSLLKNYLNKIGALDKIKQAKTRGKETISSIKNKMYKIPEKYKKVKGKFYKTKGEYEPRELGSSSERRPDHRRRLLNMMNEVDEKRKEREMGTHSDKKPDHRRRLLNMMNEVDEKKREREMERIGEDRRRLRRSGRVN